MENHPAKQKIATVQIDVDGEWVIFQHFGYDVHNPVDRMYESSLPRFLDLFDQYGIKATLFVVGRDLKIQRRVHLLKEAVARGHEIANHTMNHAEGFSCLPLSKKKAEIYEADTIIKDTLGIAPKGFRAPSNDVDTETLGILQDFGYQYDSSLMATYWGPLIRWVKFFSLRTGRKDHYLGRFFHGRAPLFPYHPDPDCIFKKGSMDIIEVPITTMPFFRIPFHVSFTFATYALGLGLALFNTGYSLLKHTSLPLNLIFHTNELADPFSDKRIRRQLGLNLPLKTKEMICRHILDHITKDFILLPTREYATSLDVQ